VTTGFRCCVNDIFTLLRCYAARIYNYLLKFRDSFSVPSSRIKQSKTLENGNDRLSWNVGKKTTNLRRVTSQKREEFSLCVPCLMPLVLLLQSLRFRTAVVKNMRRQPYCKVMYFLPKLKFLSLSRSPFPSSALLFYLNMRLSLSLYYILQRIMRDSFAFHMEYILFTDSKTRVYILKTAPQRPLCSDSFI
jgi:hypothetical protein